MGSSRPLRVMWSGMSRMAHGAQQNGVAGLQQIDGAGGHHAAPAEVMPRAPVEILKREGDVVFLRGLFEHALGAADDFAFPRRRRGSPRL